MAKEDFNPDQFWIIEDEVTDTNRCLWEYASKKMGIKYAKKGTEEYEAVKQFYVRLLEVPAVVFVHRSAPETIKRTTKKPKLFQEKKSLPESKIMKAFLCEV